MAIRLRSNLPHACCARAQSRLGVKIEKNLTANTWRQIITHQRTTYYDGPLAEHGSVADFAPPPTSSVICSVLVFQRGARFGLSAERGCCNELNQFRLEAVGGRCGIELVLIDVRLTSRRASKRSSVPICKVP